MKDRDADTHLTQYLSGDSPPEAFKQQVLRDSTAEFVRVRRRRFAWRRTRVAAAAVLIAGIAFLGGRLSMPRALPPSLDDEPPVAAQRDGVNVPNELVAWLNAARLFRQLGMQDRMARAVDRASRLLPVRAVIADDQTVRVFTAASIENEELRVELMDLQGPQPSAETINRILAQALGD